MEKLDPVEKMFMFQGWMSAREETMELAKNHAMLVGSFFNPEAVKQMLGDTGNTHRSTDADMEKSLEMVKRANGGGEETTHRRRRRMVE